MSSDSRHKWETFRSILVFVFCLFLSWKLSHSDGDGSGNLQGGQNEADFAEITEGSDKISSKSVPETAEKQNDKVSQSTEPLAAMPETNELDEQKKVELPGDWPLIWKAVSKKLVLSCRKSLRDKIRLPQADDKKLQLTKLKEAQFRVGGYFWISEDRKHNFSAEVIQDKYGYLVTKLQIGE